MKNDELPVVEQKDALREIAQLYLKNRAPENIALGRGVETPAYQVTIPASVREEIGLHEGDTLEAKVEDSHIVLIPNSAEHSTSPKNMQVEGGRFAGWRPIGAKTRKNVIPLPNGIQSPLVILQTSKESTP